MQLEVIRANITSSGLIEPRTPVGRVGIEGKDMAMRIHNTSRNAAHRIDTAFVGVGSTPSEPRSASIHLLNSSRLREHRSTRMPPAQQNEMVELAADIDGLPISVRFLV